MITNINNLNRYEINMKGGGNIDLSWYSSIKTLYLFNFQYFSAFEFIFSKVWLKKDYSNIRLQRKEYVKYLKIAIKRLTVRITITIM